MTHAAIVLTIGDGEHAFDLGPLGLRLELEERCGLGLMGIHNRLLVDSRTHDYRETLRLGLIGGGMTPPAALAFVKRYVDERPIDESLPAARAVLLAALVGIPADPLGKDDAAGKPTTAETAAQGDGSATTADSFVPPSTVSALQ